MTQTGVEHQHLSTRTVHTERAENPIPTAGISPSSAPHQPIAIPEAGPTIARYVGAATEKSRCWKERIE
jgi:hypothetical protein